MAYAPAEILSNFFSVSMGASDDGQPDTHDKKKNNLAEMQEAKQIKVSALEHFLRSSSLSPLLKHIFLRSKR